MSAYFVVYLNVTDPDRFNEYFKSVMPVIERRGGRAYCPRDGRNHRRNLAFQASCSVRVAFASGSPRILAFQ